MTSLIYLPFHPGACLSCYKTSNLYQCPGCGMAYYCNELCRIKHYSVHKSICQFAKKIREPFFQLLKNCSENSKEITLKSISKLICEEALQHKETTKLICATKMSFAYYPRVCTTCGANESSTNLTSCSDCFSVFFCCFDHMKFELHLKMCQNYQLLNKCLMFAAKNISPTAFLGDTDYVPGLQERDMESFLKANVDSKICKNHSKLLVASEEITHYLSVLHCIDKIPPDNVIMLINADEFVIHIIDYYNDHESISTIHVKHYLLRFLPQFLRIRVVFLLLPIKRKRDEMCKVLPYRSEEGRYLFTKYTIEYLSMSYNEYKVSEYYTPPNLRALLNVSSVEYLKKNKLVKSRLSSNICAIVEIITVQYYRDALKIVDYLYNEKKYCVVSPLQANPFSSLCPVMYPFMDFGESEVVDNARESEVQFFPHPKANQYMLTILTKN